jgi:hypothetical protein
LGEPIPEALRETVRELMDPADGPNGAKVALSDALDFLTAVVSKASQVRETCLHE